MKRLKKQLEELGFGGETLEQKIQIFSRYRDLVLDWNTKVNLTAIKDPDEFELKHFMDSVSCCMFPEVRKAEKIIDVGTGAGFLGIPLAILFPEKEFVLLDSLNKRIKILQEISEELNLYNVRPIHGRAEDLARREEHREQYDLCVSRAVANLGVLAEYCLPFVKVGGWFGAYKTGNAEEEIRQSRQAIRILGGKLETETTYNPDGMDFGHKILWIKKENQTGKKFPRKAGTPQKEPL